MASSSSISSSSPATSTATSTATAPSQSPTLGHPILIFLFGLLFGFSFHRNHIYSNAFVASQLSFQSWIMMKTFFSGLLTATIIFQIAKSKLFSDCIVERFQSNFQCHLGRHTDALIMGASMGGIGLYIAGSCPGTVYTQLGHGLSSEGAIAMPTALAIFGGGLIGALLYSLLDLLFPSSWLAFESSSTAFTRFLLPKSLADSLIKADPALSKNFPSLTQYQFYQRLAITLFILLFALESIFPWNSDLNQLKSTSSDYIEFPLFFPPIVSGILIGVLQLGLAWFGSAYLGNTGGFFTLLSFIIPSSIRQQSRYLSNSTRNYVQLLFAIGAIAGTWWDAAYQSATFQSNALIRANEMAIHQQSAHRSLFTVMIGGAMLVFGARLSNGCTSGHGISGLALNSTSSAIVVMFMFASAIGSGMLDQYVFRHWY